MENKKQVKIWDLTINGGEHYLLKGTYLGDCLGLEFETWQEDGKKNPEENIFNLIKTIKTFAKQTLEKHFNDQLLFLFHEYVTIDFAQALQIHLFDILRPAFLTPVNDAGSAIIDLLESAGLHFIVVRRDFISKDFLEICVVVTHEDYTWELHGKLLAGLNVHY